MLYDEALLLREYASSEGVPTDPAVVEFAISYYHKGKEPIDCVQHTSSFISDFCFHIGFVISKPLDLNQATSLLSHNADPIIFTSNGWRRLIHSGSQSTFSIGFDVRNNSYS